MERDYKLPSPYKSLLMVALVLGPFYWLAFTEDGQRRTDLALMFLLGKPELNAAMELFTSALTETRFRETFPKLEFQCAEGANPFGDRLCAAEIGAFNAMPAASVTLFMVGEQLRAVKVSYRRAYHPLIREWVEARIDDLPEASPAVSPPAVSPVIQDGVAAWDVPDGVLVLRDGPLENREDPALFWLSGAVMAGRRPAGSPDQVPFQPPLN